MNIPTTILLALSLSIAACGEPCGVPTVRPSGVWIAAEECRDPDDSSSSSGGSSSSGEDPTTTGACPGPGEAWGPCVDDACSDVETPSLCIVRENGNLCAPLCAGDCPVPACDGALGFCDPAVACLLACADDFECPTGMYCDASVPGGGCLWPL